jgi:phosphopantothenoylcysteine synthetase/decarboxylase
MWASVVIPFVEMWEWPRSGISSCRPALEAATGHPVRSEYKQPDVLPPPDAIVVAPATFNTINKWAAGISDTLALGLLTEAIGKRLPVVALPFVNAAQAEHPAFQGSIDRLRAASVQLLYGPNVLELHEPGTEANESDCSRGG